MKRNYRTLEYYQYWFHRLEKKKDFLKAYIEHVNSLRSGGRCMFACSFLCCCCCSRIGRDALIICDFSKNWINSIQKTYEKKTSEEIKKIAREAISVLENTRKKIYDKGSIIKNKNYIDWMNNHNDTLYRIHDIYTDGWMHRIFNSLYNMAITTVQIDYSLSENDINKLFVAMPLFYPVIYQSEDYSFQMRENIVDTIQRMLT